jgi:hypothetical protein
LAHQCVRSERQIAGEQPCRAVKCVTRHLNRMRTTRHWSPALSPPARNRGEVHPPARLGQGLGHFPRARIWDTAPNPGCLDVHLPSHSDCGDCPWARSRTGRAHVLPGKIRSKRDERRLGSRSRNRSGCDPRLGGLLSSGHGP